jgi:hypothetical protein|tara:strand:- start:185 stop:376 length:192 start_codon:yes stop_codon:yes gene_type:complete
MIDLTHGILMFFFGTSITFIGFLIAFLIINYNHKAEKKKLVKETGPLADLRKMMYNRYGDDCQ